MERLWSQGNDRRLPDGLWLDAGAVEEVAFQILHIPGDKVVSIATKGGQGIFTFSDGEPNTQSKRNLPKLLELLLDGIIKNGIIIIRQFTGETRRTTIRGVLTIVPTVNTYAIRLTKGKWYGLSAHHAEIICSANLRSGERVSHPPGVKYLDFVS